MVWRVANSQSLEPDRFPIPRDSILNPPWPSAPQLHLEDIRDLLEPESGSDPPSTSPSFRKAPITIRETPGGVMLVGATEVEVFSKEQLAACLESGLLRRATAGHNMNARSRSARHVSTEGPPLPPVL